MSKLLTEVRYSLIAFFRNKGGVFWTMGFPVVLMIILGFIWGGGSLSLTLYYADHDGSAASSGFIAAINATGAVTLKDDSGLDLAQMLKDGKISAYLDIPQGFGRAGPSSSDLYYDRSQQSSMAIVSVVQQVADQYSLRMANARPAVIVQPKDVTTAAMSTMEFMLPGIIGMSIMQSAINATVALNARNRARGVFRKLATTPISRLEWNASKMISQSVLTLISVAISVAAAGLLFSIHPAINLTTILLFVAGTATFVGLGLIMAALVKSEESATSAAGIVSFPLMFISGSFFPVDSMPWFFKAIADVSPLTYLNNGLRDAMISGNDGAALACLAIVALAGIVFFCGGVAAMKWKDD